MRQLVGAGFTVEPLDYELIVANDFQRYFCVINGPRQYELSKKPRSLGGVLDDIYFAFLSTDGTARVRI